MNIAKRVFFRLYPNKPKEADTYEGDDLRFVLKVCCILHGLFFLASIVAIGFISMLQDIFYSCWTYSAFLTLKEWQVILYIVTLFFGSCHGIFNLFMYSELNLLFFILKLIYYVCALYFVARAYRNFRVTGGIHGKLGRQKPKPEGETPAEATDSGKKKKKKKGSIDDKVAQLTDKLLDQATTMLQDDDEKGPKH